VSSPETDRNTWSLSARRIGHCILLWQPHTGSSFQSWCGRYIGEAGITDLPPEVGALTDLVKLNLTHNALRGLPPEFERLGALSWLWLGNNLFSEVPDVVRGLGFCA
jgi:hypothetical protein